MAMGSAVATTQFNETARMDLHQVAEILVGGLGPTLVAAMTGTKDRKLPSKWAKPDGPNPSPAFTKRLLLAHRAWAALTAEESDYLARQWFIGGNPLLGEDTPLTAIREDRGKELIGAVDAFLRDEPDLLPR
jgi:hypothetical protein